MTRRQCLELYIGPAAERSRATGDDGQQRWDWSKGIPPRASFVAAMQAQGHTADKAGEMWDRMDAAEREARRGKGQ